MNKDDVTYKHNDYVNFSDTWKKCRDATRGQEAIKKEKTTYLPKPNGMDQSDYDNYLKRAQFFNGSKRTVNAIDGQVFRKKPIVLADNQDPLDSVSIDGKSFIEYSKAILNEWSIVGRVGSLVDATIEGKPYFALYNAESIINWKTDFINEKLQFTLVVLLEMIEKENQTYSHDSEPQWRELNLIDGIYNQIIWRKNDKGDLYRVNEDPIIPKIQGQSFNFIPFFILNTSGIGYDVEEPPLNDLINTNLGHYINSADYENDLHWSGVKTPIFPGWDLSKTIEIGKPIAVDLDSKPFMLESTSGSGLSDEMTKKEERMAVLGSQVLAQKGRYLQAAKTAEIQEQGESGIIASLSDDLDSYFNQLLELLYIWGNYGNFESVTFNKDFDPGPIDMIQLSQLGGLVSSDFAAYETMFHALQKAELIPKTEKLEEYIQKIKDQKINDDLSDL